jgi:RHH-type proline utilization regulon transcriptional repressor/proline dehydrogenase/delta 1-pyrroline-5-carboxylate dehydrogenase
MTQDPVGHAPFLQPEPGLEASVREVGERLFELMAAHPSPGILSKKGAYARLMEWSMKDPVFKTQLFRFVDVLPSLNSSAEIVRHLQEYLGDKAVELNPALKAGLAASSFAPALVATRQGQIVDMAGQFVAGENRRGPAQADPQERQARPRHHDRPARRDRRQRRRGRRLPQRNLEILDSVSKFYREGNRRPASATSARRAPAPPQPLRQDLRAHARRAPGRSRRTPSPRSRSASARSCAARPRSAR